jgi:hypothetical protein
MEMGLYRAVDGKNLVAQSEASFVLTAHTKTIERDWN